MQTEEQSNRQVESQICLHAEMEYTYLMSNFTPEYEY